MQKEKLLPLVIEAQKGNSQAFNDLFTETYNDVYYFALKTVRDETLAQDITQETFVTIYKSLASLNDPVAYPAWSRQITYRHCLQHVKKNGREVLVEENEDGSTIFDTIEEDTAEFIPEESLDKDDFKKTILGIIEGLPEEQRAAIILYYYDELSVKDIADVQGVSEGTVKSRLNYGRKAIKASVEDYEKKHSIKLRCAGVLPLLLWLFAADAKAAVVSSATVQAAVSGATAAAASQAIAAGATTAATTAASGATAAAATQATATVATATASSAASSVALLVRTGAEMGIKAVGNAIARAGAKIGLNIAWTAGQKIVAGLVATAIIGGGAAAIVSVANKPETATKPPVANEVVDSDLQIFGGSEEWVGSNYSNPIWNQDKQSFEGTVSTISVKFNESDIDRYASGTFTASSDSVPFTCRTEIKGSGDEAERYIHITLEREIEANGGAGTGYTTLTLKHDGPVYQNDTLTFVEGPFTATLKRTSYISGTVPSGSNSATSAVGGNVSTVPPATMGPADKPTFDTAEDVTFATEEEPETTITEAEPETASPEDEVEDTESADEETTMSNATRPLTRVWSGKGKINIGLNLSDENEFRLDLDERSDSFITGTLYVDSVNGDPYERKITGDGRLSDGLFAGCIFYDVVLEEEIPGFLSDFPGYSELTLRYDPDKNEFHFYEGPFEAALLPNAMSAEESDAVTEEADEHKENLMIDASNVWIGGSINPSMLDSEYDHANIRITLDQALSLIGTVSGTLTVTPTDSSEYSVKFEGTGRLEEDGVYINVTLEHEIGAKNGEGTGWTELIFKHTGSLEKQDEILEVITGPFYAELRREFYISGSIAG